MNFKGIQKIIHLILKKSNIMFKANVKELKGFY